ncbi:MAG: GldG family protein [Treponema sp.]|nr:GldG family protein [Treponema sp.]
MNRKQATVLALLSIAVFLFAFLISGRLWFRADMTRGSIFTLSEVSRGLHREISEQLTITYFVSDRLALAHPMPSAVAGLLREYAAHSRGRIRTIQRDPQRSGIARSVEDLGILPWQIPTIENNQQTMATVYSGILIEYLDRAAVIPLVVSPDTLEYALTSRIRALVRTTPRELGVIVADAANQWHEDFRRLNSALFLAGFNVVLIHPGEAIPDTLPAVFVLGGAEDLSEFHLYFIDRYISGGGSALFAVDGVFVDSKRSLDARAANDGGLLTLLANYGVLVSGALALDDAALTLTFQAPNALPGAAGGGGMHVRSVRYPHWIAVREQGGNFRHRLTANFGGLDLYWASPLELVPPQGVDADVLFTSTAAAWLQRDTFTTDPGSASFFYDEANQVRGTKLLGVALSGIFPSAFEGLIDEREREDEREHPLFPHEQYRPSRIIVIGDTDFASDIMEVGQSEARNLDFLIRAADWLSGNDDLLDIRSRESAGRLDRITDPEQKRAAMALSLIANTVLVPLGVTLAGIILVRRRTTRLRRAGALSLSDGDRDGTSDRTRTGAKKRRREKGKTDV